MDYIVQLAESGLAETRALIFELVPDSLEKQGLVLALQRQAAAIQSRCQIAVSTYLDEEPDLPVRQKEALYRIAQESLNNVVKHAQAGSVSVRLAASDGSVVLTIADDGKGFDPSGDFPGHLGLVSMSERAGKFGAQFEITSEPGRGTTVTVRCGVHQN
jgi:signal transduction histidine kinase